MSSAFICDGIRTPVGRYGGALSSVRTDDLAAIPLRALMARHPGIAGAEVEDVLLGCANQAGEDNRNVARMALLLAGLPETVPGATINRLCGSGLDAVGTAARAIRAGEARLVLAGGVESMSRAPFVLAKATAAFSRTAELQDTTIGWRFVNKKIEAQYGADSMIDTAENIAVEMGISRADQDAYAQRSQEKTAAAQRSGAMAREIVPVEVLREGKTEIVDTDEHPRPSSLEKLAGLKPISTKRLSITAGNASGVNDGAAALLVASEDAVKEHGLRPLARILGMTVAGVAPRLMGLGPVPATRRLLGRLGLSLDLMDLIELNEAFAAQALGCLRSLGLGDDDPRVNPQGGAIALGHPLGMSGARIVLSAARQLEGSDKKLALCTMCIGVGQGIALVLEKA